MQKLSKLPKQYWILAIAGGAIIGLILRSKRNDTVTTQASSGGAVSDNTAMPSPNPSDYAPVYSGLDYPGNNQFDVAAAVTTALGDVPTTLANIADSQAVATASIVALQDQLNSGAKQIGKGGGAPKGKVVKSDGHPTHKKHPVHKGANDPKDGSNTKKPPHGDTAKKPKKHKPDPKKAAKLHQGRTHNPKPVQVTVTPGTRKTL